MLTKMSDDYAHILEGCRRHERRAQRALYDAFAPMAMGVCMRYATDRDDAQDLLQDGMVRVFEKIGQVRAPEGLGAWIYRLMVNECLQHLRRHPPTERGDWAGGDGVAMAVQLPDDPFAMEEIVLALQKLPPAQRLAFNLVEVEGYPFGESARMMKCSEANVRALLSRAKATLRGMLEGVNR